MTANRPRAGQITCTLEEIRTRPTISIAEVARVLDIGLNQAYAAAKAGDIPVLKLGRSYRVKVPALLALLGEAPNDTNGDPSQGPPLATVHTLAKNEGGPHGAPPAG